MDIEKDGLFTLAERYVKFTGLSVFLTGRAGTGKTTFLKYIEESCDKRHVVLAPTGVAAINAGGSTIHSFFHLPLCPYLPDVPELMTEYQVTKGRSTLKKERISLIRSLELIIIDEISMVRADLLDAVDMMLKRYRHSTRPFGGVQLLLIGDAQQLSPVVKEEEMPYMQRVYSSPYFFESKAFKQLSIVSIELKKVYRQKDLTFIRLLNAIRENDITHEVLDTLNSRVGAPCAGANANRSEPIRLTTHNRQANSYNTSRLESLPGKATKFTAGIIGEFPESSYPVEAEIFLKRGAQVMFTRNDPQGQYYNGKIGRITQIDESMVQVQDEDGMEILVTPVDWENTRYSLDDESGEITQEVVGTFTQLPLRTAWAITIHKSQGLTFDNVIIDAGAAFAFGQVYVALSRCRSLEGISLESPIRASSIFTDRAVVDFNASQPTEETVEGMLNSEEARYRLDKICSIFDLNDTVHLLNWLREVWAEHLTKIYPQQAKQIDKCCEDVHTILDVAERFKMQLSRLAAAGQESQIQERLKKGAAYFAPIISSALEVCSPLPSLAIDNKEVKKKVKLVTDDLLMNLTIHCALMRHVEENGFDLTVCDRIRTACLLGEKPKTEKSRAEKTKIRKSNEKTQEPSNEKAASEVNEILKNRLIAWRTARSKADNVPPYVVMHQVTLMQIASQAPTTKQELLLVERFGQKKFEKYGEEILSLVRSVLDV